MINKIIAFENQLLQDRKALNELITECAAGNNDELARLKIEEMQREIDVMAKQVAALKAVAQTAWPTQAGYQPNPQSPIPGQPQMQQGYRTMQSASQTGYQAQPQVPRAGGQPQAQASQMIPQGYRPQMQSEMPGQAQPGVQNGYRKLQPGVYSYDQPQKKDFEKTFGKAVLPVCASILIFISFIFFAAIVLPYLNHTVKMVLMYAVSIVIMLTGGILLLHDRENKAFLAITGCGMGALYLSLFLSDFYFRVMSDAALYIGLFIWAAVVCVLSRLRSSMFLIIGQIGVNLSVLLGAVLCGGTEDTGKLLLLVIYNILTQAVFYFSHLQREYNRNMANHVSWCIGMLILTVAVNDSYTDGTVEGMVASILLLLAACLPIVLGVTILHTDSKQNVAFGILNSLYLWAVYALISYRFENIIFFVVGIAAMILVALEARIPGTNHAGKIIFQCTLFFQILLAWMSVDFLQEYISVVPLATACLIYGFCRKDTMYKIAGMGYAILFLLVPMNGGTQLFLGLLLTACVIVLLCCFKDQYRTWMKVSAYAMFLLFLIEALSRIMDYTVWDNDVQGLVMLFILVVVNIVMTKVPALRRNLATREEELGVSIETGIIQIILMLIGYFVVTRTDQPILHMMAVVLGFVLVCTNSYSLVTGKNGGWMSVYVGTKLLLFFMVALSSYEVPQFLLSFAGLLLATVCIVSGFLAGLRTGRDFKPLRIYGLVLVMICLIKLILIDIHYDNHLLRAVSFFVSGVLCFGISLLYNLADKKIMRRNGR